MTFSNFFAEYFCSYKQFKSITFLNKTIFKKKFLENYAYHIKIKKYVLNIFQRRTEKKDIEHEKNLWDKSPVE